MNSSRQVRTATPTQNVSPRPNRLLVCLPVLVSMCGLIHSTQGEILTFTMNADGPCAGNTSSATAAGTFSLETETGQVTFEIAVVGATPEKMHIHAPADACSSALAGPVQVVLPAGNSVSGTYEISPSLMDLMIQGRHWIVIHTAEFVGGEVTGRVSPDCPNNCSGNGICILGECFCDAGWSGIDCSAQQLVPTVTAWGLMAMTLLLLTGATLVITRRQVA